MQERNEIILYQPQETIRLEVLLEDETVWLTQQQMADLFQSTKQNISLHTGNIFKEKELEKNTVVKESLTTAKDGKKYRMKYYNLDVIISVGYRVKSIWGTQFRQWANNIIKEYGQSHDRFLIIDSEIYHIGASLKDLGKKWFAFSHLHFSPQELLERINNELASKTL